MKEELTSFKSSKLAKKKGFPQRGTRCFLNSGKPLSYDAMLHGVYLANKDTDHQWKDFCCVRPTQSLLARWLREVHNIDVLPERSILGYAYYVRYKFGTDENLSIPSKGHFLTYEKALEAGLIKGLKLIKL